MNLAKRIVQKLQCHTSTEPCHTSSAKQCSCKPPNSATGGRWEDMDKI